LSENIELTAKVRTDVREALAGLQNMKKSMSQTVSELDKITKSMEKSTKAFMSNTRALASYQNAQKALNKSKTDSYSTTKQLIHQETLLHSLYTKNSQVAEKRYLNSIGGLTNGLRRYRDEASQTMVLDRGRVSLLSDQINKYRSFMIQGNMVSRTMDNMATKSINLGKNLQWTGRQMIVGITTPVVAGGALAIKTFLQMEKASVRAKKLVGALGAPETSQAVKNYKELDDTARQLATTFGSTFEDVITVAGELKGVGFSVGDTKALTDLAVKFDKLSNIGDLKKTSDFVRVIAQTQGGVQKASETLAFFNKVDEELSIDMGEIIDNFPEVANAFKLFNINVGEGIGILSSFKANGVEVSEGVTAISRGISRLAAGASTGKGRGLKQLKEFIDEWNEGHSDSAISFFDKAGKLRLDNAGLTSAAKAFGSMTDEQQSNFARLAFGTDQYRRLAPIMEAINETTINGTKANNDYSKSLVEYNKFLADTPGYMEKFGKSAADYADQPATKFAGLVQQVRLVARDIGEDLIPVASKLVGMFSKLMLRLDKISPATKKWVAVFVGIAAAIGPVSYLAGQMQLLLTTITKIALIKPLKWFFHLGSTTEKVGPASLAMDMAKLKEEFLRTGDETVYQNSLDKLVRKQLELKLTTDAATRSIDHQGDVMALNSSEHWLKSGARRVKGAFTRPLGARGVPSVPGRQTGMPYDPPLNIAMDKLRNQYPLHFRATNNVGFGAKGQLTIREMAKLRREFALLDEAQKRALSPEISSAGRVLDNAMAGRGTSGRFLPKEARKEAVRQARYNYRQAYDAHIKQTAQARVSGQLAKYSSMEQQYMSQTPFGVQGPVLGPGRAEYTEVVNRGKIQRASRMNRVKAFASGGLFGSYHGDVSDRQKDKLLGPKGPGVASKVASSFKSIGKEGKTVGQSFKDIANFGKRGLLNTAAMAQPGVMLKKTSSALVGVKAGFAGASKAMMPMADLFTGGAASAFAPVIVSVVTALGPFLLILGAIAAVIALIVLNWDKVSKGLGAGIEALKSAFGALKDAIIEPFKAVFERLNSGGEGIGDTWEKVGQIIDWLAGVFAKVFQVVAAILRPIMTIFAEIFYILVKIGQFVVNVFTGNFSAAFGNIRSIVGSAAKVILVAITTPFTTFLKLVAKMANVSIFGKRPFKGVADSIKGIAEDLENIPEKARKAIDGADDNAKKSGKNTGKKIVDGVEEEMDDLDLDSGGDFEDAGDDAADKFISAFHDALKTGVDAWKQAAIEAYEAWADAQIETIEDQIKAIDELAKREDKEQKHKEYLAKRAELLRQRSLNNEQYKIDRDAAIYEGRYDDARSLLLKHQKDIGDINDQIKENDEARQKDLIDQERDAQKERLSNQKESLKKQLDAEKSNLQKILDAITEYAPRTAAAAKAMQDQILNELSRRTNQYTAAGVANSSAFAQGWQWAIGKAQKDLNDQAFWSGDQVLGSFAAGLGVTKEELRMESDIKQLMKGTNLTYEEAKRIAESGELNVFHAGGYTGSGAPDDIPATLQKGEYVLRRSAVSKYGVDTLNALNAGAANIYHDGGIVKPLSNFIEKGKNALLGGGAFGLLSAENLKNIYMSRLGLNPASSGAGNYSGFSSNVSADKTAIKEFTKNLFSQYGWGMGQFPFLDKLLMGESGWNPKAKNPSSTAAGIFQFLDSTWKSYITNKGGPPYWTDDYRVQVPAGLDYIKGRYGTPEKALAHWMAQSPHWYHEGGLAQLKNGGKNLMDGPVYKHRGETTLTAPLSSRWESALARLENGEAGNYIHVDTFIGEEAWFKELMKKYNIKQVPKMERRAGTETRTISSYSDVRRGK
jgi:hypothetical protein